MATLAAILLTVALRQQPQDMAVAPGSMWIERPNGAVAMPMTLTHTDVNARISGFGARVNVVQTFNNPSKTPIEAVYTFPLPDDAAVDQMRVIDGEIKQRDEAREIYEQAKANGQAAALLDQERPNIFTQSVANILPGQKIEIEISYVQLLKYADGQFEFSFPMVVGPRFTGIGTPDASQVFPPITPPGARTGQDISLAVDIDAGAPIEGIESVLHQVVIDHPSLSTAHVELSRLHEIPNRDFILRYGVATDSVQSAFVSHYTPGKGGEFALIVMPPKRPAPAQISPREIIFVLDRSGSQTGFPLAKSKELTYKLMNTLRPGDTFNVISFGMDCRTLWPQAQPYSRTTADEARAFIDPIQAGGGTNVEAGITAALRAPNDSERTRIVLLNTDGFIGNEYQVIKAIHDGRGTARVFTFGIGNSVNRYAIDAFAAEGKGAAEYVTLAERADGAVERLTKRLETPVLTNVSASFSGTEVEDVTPSNLPDLFDETPIVILGHYLNPGRATVVLRGEIAGRPWSKSLELNLSGRAEAPCVPTLWARKRVEELERVKAEDGLSGVQPDPSVDRKILDVALRYGIASSQTSFVAVEPRVVNIGGHPLTVRVPVEMASGVSYQGISPAQLFQQSIQIRGSFGAGGGSGGFGGGGLVGGQGLTPAAPALKSPISTHVQSITATSGTTGRSASGGSIRPPTLGGSPQPAVDPATKISKKLRSLTGKLTVQICVHRLDDAVIKALKDAGVTIDDKDKTLKVVFGTVDAKDLLKVAKLDDVERIDPLAG